MTPREMAASAARAAARLDEAADALLADGRRASIARAESLLRCARAAERIACYPDEAAEAAESWYPGDPAPWSV